MNCRYVLFTVVPLLVALSFAGQQSQLNPRGPSFPPSANEIGPFVIPWGMEPGEKEKIVSQVRDFLWGHLQNHTPCKVQIAFGNLEGDATEHIFVVQLDKKGNTSVRDYVTTTEAALLRPGKKPKRRALLDKFCAVERIDSNTQKSIPNDETRSAESFKLHMKNCKTGAVLTL